MNVFKLSREAAGFTQHEAAEALGLSKSSISKWERGDRNPKTESIIKLWTLYAMRLDGLKLDWLVLGDVAEVRAFIEARDA